MRFNLRDMDCVTPEPERAEYLPQGDHSLLVRHAEYCEREESVYINLILEVLSPSLIEGKLLTWMVYIQDEQTAAQALKDLIVIGLREAATWFEEGKHLSEEFPKCDKKLVGKKFVAHKRLRVTVDGKVYHRFTPIRSI